MAWSSGDPYFVEDVCHVMLGLLDATGAPLAHENNTYLMTSILDYEVEDIYDTPEPSVIQNASGGKCHNRPREASYEGATMTWRRCGSLFPPLAAAVGIGDVVSSTVGASDYVSGIMAPAIADSCRCDSGVSSNGFFMAIWSAAWESCSTGTAQRVRTSNGELLWHLGLFPKIEKFVPSGATRYSDDATSLQNDWVADLKPNTGFGYGPIDRTTGDSLWSAANAAGLDRTHASFLTEIAPPSVCGSCDVLWDGTGSEIVPGDDGL